MAVADCNRRGEARRAAGGAERTAAGSVVGGLGRTTVARPAALRDALARRHLPPHALRPRRLCHARQQYRTRAAVVTPTKHDAVAEN